MLDLSHKKLEVYNIAIEFVKEIYKLTDTFPKREHFILVSQMRRSAISVCSNIAEGASRISSSEKKRFYEIGRSSLVETDTQIEISLQLEYLNSTKIQKLQHLMESLFRMLSKMIANLTAKSH